MVITGLTSHQAAMLKSLWECKTDQELQEFQMLLDPDDLRLSISLMTLVKIEWIDQMLDSLNDWSMANETIKNIIDKGQ